jgi:hypothetical protein
MEPPRPDAERQFTAARLGLEDGDGQTPHIDPSASVWRHSTQAITRKLGTIGVTCCRPLVGTCCVSEMPMESR